MIIDKVKLYRTEEEQQRLDELREEEDSIVASANEIYDLEPGDLSRILEIHNQEDEINNTVEDRYIKTCSKKKILEDAEEIINAIEKADFQKRIEWYVSQLASMRKKGTKEEELNQLRDLFATENYENCCTFILLYLRVQLNALADDEDGREKIKAFIDKRVSLWYVQKKPHHFAVPTSKPTDAFAFLKPKKAVVDAISGDATIDQSSVRLKIYNYRDLDIKSVMGADKLLNVALEIFAQKNDFSKKSKTAKNMSVVIPLREYAARLGADVLEHGTSTPEEAEAEKKRIKNILDNVRKEVKKDLDILYNLSFEWEEYIDHKLINFSSVRLLAEKGYNGGNIYLEFTQKIADNLVARRKITQFNAKLLQMDKNHSNAYFIMRKLEEHYNMLENQERNRHDRLRVTTILSATDLPTFEEVEKTDRGHWEKRIKDRLEENLEYLVRENYLKSWEYAHEKGVPLTDEEAENITDYNTFSKLYILFAPADKVDHSERLEKRKAERAARTRQKKGTTKKKA